MLKETSFEIIFNEILETNNQIIHYRVLLQSSSDLLGLIQVMIVTFGDLPPVYAKPKEQVTPYPTQRMSQASFFYLNISRILTLFTIISIYAATSSNLWRISTTVSTIVGSISTVSN